MPAIFVLFFVFVISFGSPVQAEVDGPGEVGIATPEQQGGIPAYPIKSAISTTKSTAETAKNTKEMADDGKKAAGQRSGLAKLDAAVKKAMALYNSHMQRKSTDFNLANTHKDKNRSPVSRLAAASLGSLTALKATTGPIDRATKNMYGLLPKTKYEDIKDKGQGGTHLEALGVLKELCESKALPSNISQRLAASGSFGGCSTDSELEGMAVSTAMLTGAPKGVRAGPGGKENKAIIAGLRLLRFGNGVQTIMASGQYKSIPELLQAELNHLQGPDGKISAAVFKMDKNSRSNIFKASIADDKLVTQMKGVGSELTGANMVAQRIESIAKHVSLPNPGADIYKDAAKQAKEFTGDEQPYDNGRYPSAAAATEIAAGAGGRLAEKAANAGNTEAEAGQTATSLRGNMEQSRTASLDANKTPPADTAAFDKAVGLLAMVIDSQEHQTFIANLDPTVLEQVTIWAKEGLRDAEIQVTANYNSYLHYNNIPVLYAVNGDKFPSNMKGMLASIGVDGSTMLPSGDKFDVERKFQMATLSPILDMKQYDAIEPAAIQLALRESVEVVTQVAQAQPITAAIKAIPIAAVSHQ